jgi:hypothetical protein
MKDNLIYTPFIYSDITNDPSPNRVYIHPTKLEGLIISHASRPICKIVNHQTGRSILRYVSGKSMKGLNGDCITMDSLNAKELLVKEGHTLTVKNATYFERNFIFPVKHPDEAIRIAFYYFILSIIFTLCLSIYQLIKF